MVTMRLRGLSFDSKAVIRSMDPVKRAALSRAGATVRLVAKRSIRRRKGSSAPGQPPHRHGGSSALTRLLFYAWDPGSESVVVGPLRFGPDGAAALEHGGTTRMRTKRRGRRVTVRKRIEARPFMGPAREKVEPRMAGFFAMAAAKQRKRSWHG